MNLIMHRSLISAPALLCSILIFSRISSVSANLEGDALNAFKANLADPNNVLESWNQTSANTCDWMHITCNSENSTTRIDLGNANLSGQMSSNLGLLPNLQYLILSTNNISGRIPLELGNLTNLVSLELFSNALSGPIPDTLGGLQKLRFLHLNNNFLTGQIPYTLTTINSLQDLDLSNNSLTGKIPTNGSFSLFTQSSFQDNQLEYPLLVPPSPPPVGKSATGSIAVSYLLFAAPVFLFIW